jgi:ParB-like chromosome segregation protein Spo0J
MLMPSLTKLSDLTPDQNNANLGTERGSKLLETSISKFGTGRSILIDKNGRIIAGNKTAETAGQLGLEDVVVVESDGTQIVAVKRTDLDLEEDNRARELAYADNRVAELDLHWDIDKLQQDLEQGIDLEAHGLWAGKELENIMEFNTESVDDYTILDIEKTPVGMIKDHPDNYRLHPDDQLGHIIESIKQHGLYKNIIVANDNTILAGHGVMRAVRKMGLKEVPVTKLPIDKQSPQAIKILTGDNEISRLSEVDDRSLSHLLKSIKEHDLKGLLGTGFDDMMLANLVMITRPQSEIQDLNEASEWVGMPDFNPIDGNYKITINFKTEADREQFSDEYPFEIRKRESKTWTTIYPFSVNDDLMSVKFAK